MLEFDAEENKLYYIETEKIREHDCSVKGVDFNIPLQLLVTGDKKGIIRLWTSDKKFLREIVLPDPIDSVCFVNSTGDILVSHA